MDAQVARAIIGSAVDPRLGRGVAAFDGARRRFAAARRMPTTVAVVGLTPGEGRTSVAALLALTVAAWSERRIVVLDTVTAPTGPQPTIGGTASVRDVAGRTITALLDGDVRQGRLPGLIGTGEQPVVGRRRIRSAGTPGAAVPVLGLPPGGPGFPPQLIEQTLQRLRYRADLVVIDTPAGPDAPVLHGVLEQADHLLLVARGDGDVDRRLQAAASWPVVAPGRGRRPTVSAVVVARGWARPSWRFDRLPVQLIGRDEGLRRRRLDRLGRRAVIAGLDLATQIAGIRAHAADPGWQPGPGASTFDGR